MKFKIFWTSSQGWYEDMRIVEIDTIEALMELSVSQGHSIIVSPAHPNDVAAGKDLPVLEVYDEYRE